jgi:hypothetical protein
MNGWLTRIGDFRIERREIVRPAHKPYYQSSHTMIGVLHTTEGDTIEGAYAALEASRSAPHFIAGEGRIIQCRPLSAQAAALRSGAEVATNANAALQIEMVARAKETSWLPVRGSLDPALAIMKWAAGPPLDIPLQRPLDAWRDDCTDCSRPWASAHNSRRLAPGAWPRAKGWYMHLEVPENTHWDCGALRLSEMLERARR